MTTKVDDFSYTFAFLGRHCHNLSTVYAFSDVRYDSHRCYTNFNPG